MTHCSKQLYKLPTMPVDLQLPVANRVITWCNSDISVPDTPTEEEQEQWREYGPLQIWITPIVPYSIIRNALNATWHVEDCKAEIERTNNVHVFQHGGLLFGYILQITGDHFCILNEKLHVKMSSTMCSCCCFTFYMYYLLPGPMLFLH